MMAGHRQVMHRLFPAILLCSALVGAAKVSAAPRSSDTSLVVEKVVDAPGVVHPVGIAFDKKGRLLVIESHTHFPPPGYKGEKHDRVLMFELKDGKAVSRSVFFEGTTATMDIAAHPDGSIYLATRSEILRLDDKNGDGRIEKLEQKRIVFCDTKGNYPHNGLSGLVFDRNGDLFFGMGENLGAAYTLRGSDAIRIRDEAEGGNVFWCRKDGSHLRRVATGFWNPFGAVLDPNDNLFVVDNDPDSTPYCRLLHVIEGGYYGYQFRYGRSGLHPFQSWQGTQYGSLPMVSPTTEAPCELIRYDWSKDGGLPGKYRGLLMTASWANHKIECFELRPRGASFRAKRSVLIEGDEEFRPVGIAVAPDGSLYVSDWVKRDYKLHGHGRIWRVRAKDPSKVPATAPREIEPNDPQTALARMLNAKTPWSPSILMALLEDRDPFIRSAAIHRLAGMLNDGKPSVPLPTPAAVANATRRLGVLLAHKRSRRPGRNEVVALALKDPDVEMRFHALKWIADEKLGLYRTQVEGLLSRPDQDQRLYVAALSALARIDGLSADDRRLHVPLRRTLLRPESSDALRRTALRLVDDKATRLSISDLAILLRAKDAGLRGDVAQVLADHQDPGRFALLRRIAFGEQSVGQPSDVRANAIAGLSVAPDQIKAHVDALVSLAKGDDETLRASALRALIGTPLSAAQRRAIEGLAQSQDASLRDMAQRAMGQPFAKGRPGEANLVAWQNRLDKLPGKADPAAGRHVFFHPKLTGCYRCHRVKGYGRRVGPDLSGKASGERGGLQEPLLQAILQPSKLVQPQFYAWRLEMKDGEQRIGFYKTQNRKWQTYIDTAGHAFRIDRDQLANRDAVKQSIMPAGLVSILTDGELRDLIAFLEAQR